MGGINAARGRREHGTMGVAALDGAAGKVPGSTGIRLRQKRQGPPSGSGQEDG